MLTIFFMILNKIIDNAYVLGLFKYSDINSIFDINDLITCKGLVFNPSKLILDELLMRVFHYPSHTY